MEASSNPFERAKQYLAESRVKKNAERQEKRKQYQLEKRAKLMKKAKEYLARGSRPAPAPLPNESENMEFIEAADDWEADYRDAGQSTEQDASTRGGCLDGLISPVRNVSAEFMELVKKLKALKIPRPTYIELSKAKWDEIRDGVSARFEIGMSVRAHPLGRRLQRLYSACPICRSATIQDCDEYTKIKVISIAGMVEEKVYSVACMECDWRPQTEKQEMVRISLWPADTKFEVFFDFNFLFFVSLLCHFSPSLSLGSLLSALKFATSISTEDALLMKQDIFNYTFSEWRRQESAYFRNLVGGQSFACPACTDSPHAVHIDGNMKLYRYNRQNTKTSNPVNRTTLEEEASQFFVSSDDVGKITARLNYHPENKVDDSCGPSKWKAAKVKSSLHAKKDVTGCMLATCRHCFLLKGLDMTRGEIYAYPYALQKEFPGANFIALDTMCRYWPWLKKVDPAQAKMNDPFLSVMHAKGHQWKCQVTWSGRCREGVGLSTGETTELANSYMSRLGVVTRAMENTGRRRRLEDGASFWNLRKNIDLPAQIKKSLNKALANLPILKGKVEDHCARLRMSLDELRSASNELASIGEGLDKTEMAIQDLAYEIYRINERKRKVADTSKYKTKLETRRTAKWAAVRKAADTYVAKHPEVSVERIEEGVRSFKFPWSGRSCGLNLTPELLLAIEDCHLADRTKEEVSILETERNKLVQTLYNRYYFHSSETANSRSFLARQLQKCQALFSEECEDVEFAARLVFTDNEDDDDDDGDEDGDDESV